MTPAASFRASQGFNRASWVQSTTPTGSSFINRSETTDTEALPPHPSHATVRDWMPVSEALRLADLWTVGDLDNSGQWRAAIKVLADETRAALAQLQQVSGLEEAFRAAWRQEVGSGSNTAGRDVAFRVMCAALAAPQAAEPQQDSLACYRRALVFMVGRLDHAATVLENAGRPVASRSLRDAITEAWRFTTGRRT